MRGWFKAGLAVLLAMAPMPAMAQSLGNGSDGEAFLKAIEEDDAAAALPLLTESASRVVNYRGYKGDTALHIATRRRDLTWVAYLLSKGADPNIGDKQGDTALIIASRIGFEEGAREMLVRRARPDATNRRGETALIMAVQQRQPRLVKLLLEAGADPDKADHAAGYTARDYAKRDTRNPVLLKLIETTKSQVKPVAGPSIN